MADIDPKQAEKGIKNQLKEYRKLQQVADDEAFKTYFDNQLRIVASKLIWGFGTKVDKETKKSVDNIEDWDDFCKWRGEIIARLQPLQEVYSAGAMIKYLEQQLDLLYRKQVS